MRALNVVLGANLMIPEELIIRVRQTASALKKGLLAVIPTDTVYGIAAAPFIPDAVEKLCEAKGRDRGKPIPLLACGIEDIERYGAVFNRAQRRLAEKMWPGPLTMILPMRKTAGLSADVCEGFRVPDCEVTLELLKMVGGILRVTSANRSGKPPALTAADAVMALGRYAEIVLDTGQTKGNVVSSVVKVNEDGTFVLLREGAVSADEIHAVLAGL